VLRIRDAEASDAAAINALYNALVDTTTVAWMEHHEPLADRQHWLADRAAAGDAVLVADADGCVVGFAGYGDFRNSAKWPGYRFSAEHSVHVDRAHWGGGIGRLLMEELLARASAAGKHVMVGAVDSENAGSLRFHERLGFVEVGRMPELGFKFERWLTLVLFQKILD
jgi:L-amino acid N-acyltransferase YncA